MSFRRPLWSDDGGTVFLGYAKWAAKPPQAKKIEGGSKVEEDDPPAVDVWHWRDTEVMAKQKIGSKANLQKNMLAAWNIDSGTLIPLGRTADEQVAPLKRPQSRVCNGLDFLCHGS